MATACENEQRLAEIKRRLGRWYPMRFDEASWLIQRVTELEEERATDRQNGQRIADLEAALKPFADRADALDKGIRDRTAFAGPSPLFSIQEDLYEARRVLRETPEH